MLWQKYQMYVGLNDWRHVAKPGSRDGVVRKYGEGKKETEKLTIKFTKIYYEGIEDGTQKKARKLKALKLLFKIQDIEKKSDKE